MRLHWFGHLTCEEERFWAYWEKDAEDGADGQEGRPKRMFMDVDV